MLLDSGNFTDNPTEAGDIRTRGLLEAMHTLGYRVVNVGERDLAMGHADLLRRLEGIPLELVSSNIVKQGTRDPVFKPYTVIEVPSPKGPLRVGVMGAVRYNPVWQKAGPSGTNLAILPAPEMIRKILPEVRAKADVLVVLAGMSKDDAHNLAKQVPELDFIFGAYGGIVSAAEEVEGKTRIYYTGNQGKDLGETRCFVDAERRPASSVTYIHHLIAKYPEHPDGRAMIDAINAKIRAAVGPQAVASSPTP